MRLAQRLWGKLFYLLPAVARRHIIKRRWSGSAGDQWHSYHLLERTDKESELPIGWEKRSDVLHFMVSYCSADDPKLVFIDYGCGNGLFTESIRKICPQSWFFRGFDINSRTIEGNSKRYPHIDFCDTDFEAGLEKYDRIVIYFGSTLAYLELMEIKRIINNLKSLNRDLVVIATDTVKGNVPHFKSPRNNFAYNYNLEKLFEKLELQLIFTKTFSASSYTYQQVAGQSK
jgi:hypothetical protein